MYKMISFLFLILIFPNSYSFASCSGAESEAYDGYRDARKAYRADDLGSCQRYAKKAYRHASNVESYASSC